MSYKRRTLSPDSPYAAAAALLTVISAGIRFASFALSFSQLDFWMIAVDYALPVIFCLIMTWVLLSRRNNLMPMIAPMIMYFASAALGTVGLDPARCAICAAVYSIVPAVYALTVAGTLNSRAPLVVSCAAVMSFSLVFKAALIAPVSDAAAFLPDLSIVFVTASVLVEARGMRRGRLY
ncbi:MAG: hypothetical protein ILO42_00845 [Clostridia bacterium]|nr:hypothetical protein [Clostridia bacterium]MBP5269485.1 hypothetical protein [Clostridia bacterium]